MQRLTDISSITGLPMPIKLMESCGEDGCLNICEEYCENDCKGCPVQECITKLHEYQESNLEPEEVKQLRASEDYWHREAVKWANKLGENKMRIRKILNQFGIPEGNIKDNELEKFLS